MSGISSSVARAIIRRAGPGMSGISSSLRRAIIRPQPRPRPGGGDLVDVAATIVIANALTEMALMMYTFPSYKRELERESERLKARREEMRQRSGSEVVL